MRWGIGAILLFLTLFPVAGARADEVDHFILPLAEPYILIKHDHLIREHGTPYVFGERSGGSRSWDTSSHLYGVNRVAVVDRAIIGSTNNGFFILQVDREDEPARFTAESDWKAALAQRGIDPSTPLGDPMTLIAGVPNRELRPWQYRVMDGWFGWTDSAWSLALQIVGMVIALLFGTLMPESRGTVPVVITVAVLTNIVAQIFIAGGGPGAAVGFFALPLLYLLAMVIGRGLAEVVRAFKHRSKRMSATHT